MARPSRRADRFRDESVRHRSRGCVIKVRKENILYLVEKRKKILGALLDDRKIDGFRPSSAQGQETTRRRMTEDSRPCGHMEDVALEEINKPVKCGEVLLHLCPSRMVVGTHFLNSLARIGGASGWRHRRRVPLYLLFILSHCARAAD